MRTPPTTRLYLLRIQGFSLYVPHEIVYDICKVYILRLKDSLQKLRSGLAARL